MFQRWLSVVCLACVFAILAGWHASDASVRFANTGDGWWGNEWADWHCENQARWSQTAPFRYGIDAQRYYWISLQDGDDFYGERCELTMGNTSAANIRRVGGPAALFHLNDDLWIGFKYRLMPGFAFAPAGAPVGIAGDGGLIQQIKQLGSCGTPALGIVATKTVTAVRNSAGNGCESGSMHSLQSWPTRVGTTQYVLQHIIFSTSDSAGLVDTWADIGDGAGLLPRGAAVHTHTMKSPTDHPAGACDETTPCSHARVGIYRDPDVSGPSIIRHDNFVVSTTQSEAFGIMYGP
jgi:hypothetical protein